MSDRVLTQEEIDKVFRNAHHSQTQSDPTRRAQPYDFRRPDRIAKDQLRAIHLLHENFARALGSSLSAYLRAYVVVNLVSVEQLSFIEFSRALPSPSCLVSLGMKPFEGNAVLEINTGLVFPILEMLLGGSQKAALKITREITEIEQSILDGLFRITLHDLKIAWQAVTPLEFKIESYETDPQLLQILAPNEAVVAVSLEVRVGELSGMMNIGIPSIIVKMLRHKFDQQWSVRKSDSTEQEQARILRLVKAGMLEVHARLDGPKLKVEDLLDLQVDDVLAFDTPIESSQQLTVNGRLKYQGQIVTNGRNRAFEIHHLHGHGQ
jgi:flagellar motor switch protein FliM